MNPPSPRIIQRAADIWVSLLSNPKYDNLGNDTQEEPISVLRNRMAGSLAEVMPRNNTPDVLARFAEELKKILSGPYEWESEWNGKKEKHISHFTSLSVDYGPDVALHEAAKKAGLEMEFPWKTSMWLNENSLSVSNGYAAPSYYHYPLKNDRWLVTRLRGEDISKIIALVEDGILTPELTPV